MIFFGLRGKYIPKRGVYLTLNPLFLCLLAAERIVSAELFKLVGGGFQASAVDHRVVAAQWC